jgi:NADH-quinone oxidoreductase subunit L
LAFASLTQVGIIVVEIGCGLRYIALIHIIGHACLRTLQLLRAPSLLHDYHTLENAIGGHLEHAPTIWSRLLPYRVRAWVYRIAMERGFFDALLNSYIVRPFLALFRWCDGMERRWTNLLSGGESRESDEVKPHDESLEEFV